MGFEDYADEPVMVDGMYQAKSGLNYTSLFFYEKKFFNDRYVLSKKDWMQNNWYLSLVYAFLYILCVFGGQKLMKDRQKFDLRRGLVAWNFVLASFSIMGTIRVWPEFIYTIKKYGIEHSVCNNDYTHGVNGCWGWLFLLSKVPELIDTVFIIMRKQELIFLHWYHHATVLVYCWYSCQDFTASGRWFVLMNYTVHAAMYTYYGLRALRFKIPKWVNIIITTGQISQMIIGIMVNTIAYMKKSRGEPCQISDNNIKWSFLMYFSYFVLFFNFFYKAYVSKPRQKKLEAAAAAKKNGNIPNGVHKANGTANGAANGVINGHISQEINNNIVYQRKSNGTKKID